jgi:tetrahydromethanopterin S-methyltransferase subunit D
MRRIGNSSGLRRRWARTATLFAGAAVSALLATAAFASPASAAVTCGNAGAAVTVLMTAEVDEATFLRGPAREILVNGVQCGTATTENTETVTVTGADEDQYVYIDLAGGPFVSLHSSDRGYVWTRGRHRGDDAGPHEPGVDGGDQGGAHLTSF